MMRIPYTTPPRHGRAAGPVGNRAPHPGLRLLRELPPARMGRKSPAGWRARETGLACLRLPRGGGGRCSAQAGRSKRGGGKERSAQASRAAGSARDVAGPFAQATKGCEFAGLESSVSAASGTEDKAAGESRIPSPPSAGSRTPLRELPRSSQGLGVPARHCLPPPARQTGCGARQAGEPGPPHKNSPSRCREQRIEFISDRRRRDARRWPGPCCRRRECARGRRCRATPASSAVGATPGWCCSDRPARCSAE